MSIRSMLRERAGQQVHIRDVSRVPSGSPVRMRLAPATTAADTVEAARILARRHLTLRQAHAALTRMVASGSVVVGIPVVESLPDLVQELREVGIAARRHEPPASVNVTAIRRGTGLSQEEFALTYGLDVGTVKNWEQGRSQPDRASRAYLWMIRHRPEVVEETLDTPA